VRYVSVRDWNEAKSVAEILTCLSTGNVALVSDAGTPLLSDPGYKLVRAAREEGHRIVPIPGPSAVTAALSVSGLPTNRFVFWGFWSRKYKLMDEATNVIFESPVRLGKTLTEIKEGFPTAQIKVAKELTKVHEDILDGEVEMSGNRAKGEATILVYIPQGV
jgi:16S rRNA (cytidine1402-2'-O)-methyltransferase